MTALALAAYGCAAFALSALLGFLLLPAFRRYALQRPNGRSSHREPTPQGGGIAVLVAALALWATIGFAGSLPKRAIISTAILIAVMGAWDDLRPLPWRLRFGVQAVLIAALLWAMPLDWRLMPALPRAFEFAMALLLGLWFVNLVNFMDGIDGMLVMGLTPLFLAIGVGFFGLTSAEPLALLLGGALAGFFVLNRPKALVFAGDVGALALGLLAAALLYRLATHASLIAALILPMYFVLDASTTLLMRLLRRADLTQAHREHAYQRAFDRGMPVWRIITAVLLLNSLLVALAAWAIHLPQHGLHALGLATALNAALILLLRHGRRSTTGKT